MFLEVIDLVKYYQSAEGRVPVLTGISLSLEAGTSLALTGESGSGKSTLLHLIGGLDVADAGSIRLAEYEITTLDDRQRARLRREKVAVIFQQFNLIPSLDIAANIAFQARLNGRFDASYCADLTNRLGLSAQASKFPDQLSGGQQQRVAIARTLAARPSLVLADEPTGNLDEKTADDVLTLLLDLVRDAGTTLLMVTHSERLAARLDRRIHLSAGRVQ